ncbi:SDR family oxidoreductase [Reichenbachiella versicolor]|uniref:SDR family oxidoreductase n=1 Tax=Reichenbachiella versicolor TaxID=1821036 RepID=UPI000D6E17F0|nr:SDR family NAD(P)-dependent oxidoreductase [Reichenbachiella versicolor]
MILKEQIAIVTGASKGIGSELVKQLLELGVKVAGWSRTNGITEHENYYFCSVDVSNPDQVREAYRSTVDYFGKAPTVLVNNAGVGFVETIDEMSFDHWKLMFDINVNGVFHCSQAVIPAMKDFGFGHIINIGSVAGRNPVKNMVGYAGTKHAVTGISHSMFMELRDFGIKVTCIYPGSVKTQFFDDMEEVNAHDNMMMPQDVASSIIHCLNTPPNYLPVDFEVRPLKPKG